MKQIKTLLAALFVAMAGTASAQTNYVHITLNDNSVVHYSQDDIKSMIIDTEAPAPEPEKDYVEFTSGTNTVKVATMNLGATTVADSPETSYGSYYAWGATKPFATVTYTSYNSGTVTPTEGHEGGYSQANAPFYNGSAYTKYTSSSDATLEDADDAVKQDANWGTGWHMPTQAEFQTLLNACGGSYTSFIDSNSDTYPAQGIYGVKGSKASGVTIGGDTYKVNGMLFVQDATHHVFFPTAGDILRTEFRSSTLAYSGSYWSSTVKTDQTEAGMRLNLYYSSNAGIDWLNRLLGASIRPFKD